MKYRSLATTFWNTYAAVYDTLLVFRPYRAMVEAVCASIPRQIGGRVLDAGCGTGNVSVQLASLGMSVSGIDAAGAMLARARRKLPTTEFQACDLDRPLPFPDASFDGVTCSNVLYSLNSPPAALKELCRVLKPHGTLALSNPRPGFSMAEVLRQHWSEGTLAERAAVVLAFPRLLMLIAFNLFLMATKDRAALYFPEPQEMLGALQEAGFEGIEISNCYADQGYLARARRPVANEIAAAPIEARSV